MRFKDLFRDSGAPRNEWGDQSRRFGAVTAIDYSLAFTVGALLVLGLIMVYSASISLADSPKYQTSETHFVLRQAIYIAIGLIAGGCVFRLNMAQWERLAKPLAFLGIVSLFLVFVPGLGHTVNGATRWIGFGPANLQVSEVVKFVSIIWVAYFTVRRQDYMHSVTLGLGPVILYVSFVGVLLALQPDLGATIVIGCIVLGIIFLGGLNWSIIIALSVMMISSVVASVALAPWRTARVLAYLNPWDAQNQIGKAYQLTHSLIAFGRGELFGVGLGASVEKMHYLPEAHTDFILAVIGEELGLVGVTLVIFLFYWLVRRAFEIGRQAVRFDQVFSGLVAQGIGIWMGVQAMINIGVAIGVFPTKGLTLPLVSYGGSSLVLTLCALALLFRVDFENRLRMRGKGRF